MNKLRANWAYNSLHTNPEIAAELLPKVFTKLPRLPQNHPQKRPFGVWHRRCFRWFLEWIQHKLMHKFYANRASATQIPPSIPKDSTCSFKPALFFMFFTMKSQRFQPSIGRLNVLCWAAWSQPWGVVRGCAPQLLDTQLFHYTIVLNQLDSLMVRYVDRQVGME